MTQITTFLEKEELLAKNQSGFRKGHCTISTCIKIKNDILKAMNRGEVTLAVLADFSKAFDTVDFETLMKKLHSLRFSKSTLLILSSYLSNRKQYVQINDQKSEMLTVGFFLVLCFNLSISTQKCLEFLLFYFFLNVDVTVFPTRFFKF